MSITQIRVKPTLGDINSIAIVNYDFYPQGNLVGRQLLALSGELAKIADVFVIAGPTEQEHPHVMSGNLRMHVYRGRRKRPRRSHKLIVRAINHAVYVFHVCFLLVRLRPSVVYVGSNPPIIVPFLCAIYAKLGRKTLIYQIQDIHPEAFKLRFGLPTFIENALRYLDNIVLKQANLVIVLTSAMKKTIFHRGVSASAKLMVLNNPYLDIPKRLNDVWPRSNRVRFIFCGNMGLFQNVPTLLEGIEIFLKSGKAADFIFIGGGIYQNLVWEFGQKYPNVRALGPMQPDQAISYIHEADYGIVSLESAVLDFAFPSKISTYVGAGLSILSVSGQDDSLARLIREKNLGIACDSEPEAICQGLSRCMTSKKRSHSIDAVFFPNIQEWTLTMNDQIQRFNKANRCTYADQDSLKK